MSQPQINIKNEAWAENSYKRKDFWRGVGLSILMLMSYFAFYALMFPLNDWLPHKSFMLLERFFLPAQILITVGYAILTIYLGFKRPRMALGILASIGVLFALSVIFVLILLISGVCFGMC
jgi:hypothetical protein